MSSVEKLTISIDLLVSFARLLAKTMVLLHWFAKKSVIKFSFSLKFVINLFSWKRGSILGIFLLLWKVFKMDQYAFGLVAGLANLLENLK